MNIDMNWINANGGILAVIGSFITLYGFLRMASKKDTEMLVKEMHEIKLDIKSIDTRLSRLEGRFEERGQWEVKEWKKQKAEGE